MDFHRGTLIKQVKKADFFFQFQRQDNNGIAFRPPLESLQGSGELQTVKQQQHFHEWIFSEGNRPSCQPSETNPHHYTSLRKERSLAGVLSSDNHKELHQG